MVGGLSPRLFVSVCTWYPTETLCVPRYTALIGHWNNNEGDTFDFFWQQGATLIHVVITKIY